MQATSSGSAKTLTPFGIYLSVNNGVVTGQLRDQLAYPVFACTYPFTDFNPQLSGTIDAAGNLQLKSVTPNTGGSIFSMTAKVSGTELLNATYSIAGGCTSDAGTVTGNSIPAVTGVYSGTMVSKNSGQSMQVTATLTQSPSVDSQGLMTVSGSENFTGSPCLSTATVQTPLSQNSGLAGVSIGVTLVSATNAAAAISMQGSVSADAKQLTLAYAQLGGNCSYDAGSGVLTLQ